MSDYFSNNFWPVSFFPDDYFGGGDDGGFHGFGILEAMTGAATLTLTTVAPPQPQRINPAAGSPGMYPYPVDIYNHGEDTTYKDPPRPKRKPKPIFQVVSRTKLPGIEGEAAFKTRTLQSIYRASGELPGLDGESRLGVTYRVTLATGLATIEGPMGESEVGLKWPTLEVGGLDQLPIMISEASFRTRLPRAKPLEPIELVKPVAVVRPIRKAG